ncbi:MAG: hypothetical protein GYB65_05045 [Chloroflexi bacterium]|nr:hypothetical protein [Chloroflexota bacterium]
MTAVARRNLLFSTLLLVLSAAWLFSHWPERGLWYDETVNAYFAQQSLGDIWEWCTAIDNQMPLHFVLLRLWGAAAGTSEFALRLFSVWCTLLAAAGIMALGQRIGRRAISGWVAVSVFAVSQSTLYAAFEVRPYALALALLAWSGVALWELAARYVNGQRPRDRAYWRLIGLYLLLALALLYTHYTAFFALAVHGLYVIWRVLARRPRRIALLAHLAIGLLAGYLPWLLVMIGHDPRAGTAYTGRVKPWPAFKTYVEFYAFGQHIAPPAPPHYAVIVGLVVLLALGVGVIALRHNAALRGLVFAALTVVLPLLGLVIMVYAVQAKLSGRHGWAAWLGVALVVGVGVGALNRPGWMRAPLTVLGLLVLALPASANLHPIYNSYLREAFAYIDAHAEPGDVLVLRDGTLFTAAGYYDPDLPWIGLPDEQLTDVDRFLFFDEATTSLPEFVDAKNARQVWVLSWQGDIMDPQHLIEGMLEYSGTNQLPPGAPGFGDVMVARYRLDVHPDEFRAQAVSLAQMPGIQAPGGGPAYLGGYVVGEGPYHPGDWVVLHTWWRRADTDVPDMRLSLRLYTPEAEDDVYWGWGDQPPVSPSFGQENWATDELIFSRFVRQIPPDAPPGPLDIRMVLYVLDQPGNPTEWVTVDTVEVIAWAP